jgi:hypothetical protein
LGSAVVAIGVSRHAVGSDGLWRPRVLGAEANGESSDL